jgi:hypothetical protein
MNLKTVLRLTLLFSACFLSVVLLLVYEWRVGSLSPGGFAVAFGLWCVGGSLVFVVGLFMFGRKQAAKPAIAAPPPDTAAHKQRMWIGVLVPAGFVSVFLLLVHEYRVGFLSLHGFGVACGFLIGASYLAAALGMARSRKETNGTISSGYGGCPARPGDPQAANVCHSGVEANNCPAGPGPCKRVKQGQRLPSVGDASGRDSESVYNDLSDMGCDAIAKKPQVEAPSKIL